MDTLVSPPMSFDEESGQSSGPRRSSFLTAMPSSPALFETAGFGIDEDHSIIDRIKASSIVVRLRRLIHRHSRPDYVLCGIPKKNKWRKRVKSIVHSTLFFVLISCIVFLHFIVLALYVPYINKDYENSNLILAYVTVVFELVYIVEAGLRIFSAGFIIHRSSYMRSWDNVLDVFVILIGIVFVSGRDNIVLEVLSALMALRLLRILAYFKSVQFILRALGHSFLPLLHLGWFIFCVMIFFALVGMELDTTGNLHHGCFVNYTDRFNSTKTFRVSDYPCSEYGSHECNQVDGRSYCGYWPEGPYNGMVGFDNLAVAMLTVFQCMTLEGWTTVLYLYESSVIFGVSWIYFVALIIFGSLLILNLFLGVLTSVFIGVSERQEEQGNTRALKEKRKLEEELFGYREWIRTAIDEEESVGNNPTTVSAKERPSVQSVDIDSEDEFALEELTYNGSNFISVLSWSRSKVWHFVKSHAFFWFMISVILLNLLVLLCDYYNSPNWLNNAIRIINYCLTSMYILEVCLKLFAMGINHYFVSNFNKLNFFLTCINILDIIILIHIPGIHISVSQIVNACRAIRLITVFKYTRYWHSMKAIVNAFANIWSTVLSLLGLLGVYLVLVSLLGMRLFGTRLAIPELNHPNFNSFIDAALLAFQLATTEDWHIVMYNTAESYQFSPAEYDLRWVIAVFYLCSIIIGGLLLANIFLAIAVDKLLEVNAVEQDITKRVEQMEEQRRERQKQLSALKNPTSEPTGLGRTLKKIIGVYSQTVSREEEIKRKKKNQKRRPGSGIQQERRVSNPAPLTAQERRGSFTKATSDPIDYDSFRGRFFPRRVMLKNPLRKAEESVQLQSFSRNNDDMGTRQLHTAESITSITEGLEEFDYFKRHPSASMKSLSSQDTSSSAIEPLDSVPSSRRFEKQISFDSMTSGGSMSSRDSYSSFPVRNVSDTNLLSVNLPIGSGSSPVLKPGVTPMIIPDSLNNSVRFSVPDDSVSRLVRQSSLEDIVPVEMTDDGGIEQQKRPSKLKHCWESFSARVGLIKQWAKSYFGSIELDPRKELESIPKHSTFFIIAPDNRFRLWCYNVVKSKAFQTISYTVTILSTLILAVESPVPVQEDVFCTLQNTVVYFDLAVVVWFSVEMFLKVIALGFFVHKRSYLRGLFNLIDFLIIVVTCIPLVVYFTSQQQGAGIDCYSYSQQIPRAYTIVLVLRVARPIRAIRITGLYLVSRGLLASLKRMGHIMFIGLLCIVIFAVIGVQCFKGRSFYCSDYITEYEEDCKGSYFVFQSEEFNCPRVFTRSWEQYRLNFDNIFWSILTLFTMLTKEGWQEAMYNAIDSTGQARGPRYNNTWESLIYFILYMIFVTFFLLNFIVGFIIVTFQKVGIKTYKDSGLDRNQRDCLYIALTAHFKKTYIPKNSFHKLCNSIIMSAFFEWIIFAAIFINTAILCIQHYEMSETLTKSIYWINFGFTVLFTAEAILKLIILTPSNYFRNFSRVFEILVVIGSITELILQNTIKGYSNSGFMYGHVFSAFRVLRLTLVSKNTKLVFWTLIRSFEIFPWIGVLLVLVLYMFAVSGMQLFGQIQVTSIDNEPFNAIHQYNNFENFFQAMKVMIRTFTGENWERIMLSSVNAPCYNSSVNNNTCGSPVAYVFFPLFFFLASILVLNLFVSIIIDNFDYYTRDKSILGSHHLRDFPSLWAKFDLNQSGTLKHSTVITMMKSMEPPVGWGRLCPQITAYKKMMKLNIPLLEDDTVGFNATLLAIVRQSLTINTSGSINEANADLKNNLRNVFPNVPKKMLDSVIPERADHTTGKLYGALVIQFHWRSNKISQKKLELYILHRRMTMLTIQPHGRNLLTRQGTLGSKSVIAATEGIHFEDPVTTSKKRPTHLPINTSPSDTTPKTHAILSRRSSQLMKLETIDEDADTVEVVEHSSSSSSSPSPNLISRMNLRKMSIVSESELFSTPTGSLISLTEEDEQSSSFKETPV